MTPPKERFVVYVDIGNMPALRVTDYVQEVRERWVMEAKLRGDDAWWYFVPQRSSETGGASRVERL
jgi:hypothetical protein